MPAERTPPKTPAGSASGSNARGWTQEEKAMLFRHVRRMGEKEWDKAVPGRRAQQSREQWQRVLLPFILKQCGL